MSFVRSLFQPQISFSSKRLSFWIWSDFCRGQQPPLLWLIGCLFAEESTQWLSRQGNLVCWNHEKFLSVLSTFLFNTQDNFWTESHFTRVNFIDNPLKISLDSKYPLFYFLVIFFNQNCDKIRNVLTNSCGKRCCPSRGCVPSLTDLGEKKSFSLNKSRR